MNIKKQLMLSICLLSMCSAYAMVLDDGQKSDNAEWSLVLHAADEDRYEKTIEARDAVRRKVQILFHETCEALSKSPEMQALEKAGCELCDQYYKDGGARIRCKEELRKYVLRDVFAVIQSEIRIIEESMEQAKQEVVLVSAMA